MAFSNEVNWSTADFLVMGSLLSFLVIGVEITLRLVSTLKGKLAVIAILIALFLLVWAELSVGVFGSPFAGS